MFVDELRVPVAPQQHTEIVKPSHDTLKLHAIDEEDRQRRLLLTDVIQKSVLKILRALSH